MPQSKTRPVHKTFLFNLGVIALICVGIYWLFFSSLSWITAHGEEYSVPNLKGKSFAEAEKILTTSGFDIKVDSSYDPKMKPLQVLDQQPEKGAKVKKGRTIFLTINKGSAPTIKMPNLVNLSFRSAEMLLQTNKLLLGDTTLQPDLAEDAVLAQLLNGKEIEPGTEIAQGSRIDLVIGDGLGNREMSVPDLYGMTYPEAIAVLSGSNLNYTVVFDGIITDTAAAVVYAQSPAAYNEYNAANAIHVGDVVDFRVRQNASEAPTPAPEPAE